MERRRDYRHELTYALSLKCPRSRRILDGLATHDVSASGLSFVSDVPHGLGKGDRLEIQLFARVAGQVHENLLRMATDGVIVRATDVAGAVEFHAPLAY